MKVHVLFSAKKYFKQWSDFIYGQLIMIKVFSTTEPLLICLHNVRFRPFSVDLNGSVCFFFFFFFFFFRFYTQLQNKFIYSQFSPTHSIF